MSNEINPKIFTTHPSKLNSLHEQTPLISPSNLHPTSPEDSFEANATELCSFTGGGTTTTNTPISVSNSQRQRVERAVLRLLENSHALSEGFRNSSTIIRNAFRQGIGSAPININSTDLRNYIQSVQNGIASLPTTGPGSRRFLADANALLLSLQSIQTANPPPPVLAEAPAPVGALPAGGVLATRDYPINSNLIISIPNALIPARLRREGSSTSIAVGIQANGQIRVGIPSSSTATGNARYDNPTQALEILQSAGIQISIENGRFTVQFGRGGNYDISRRVDRGTQHSTVRVIQPAPATDPTRVVAPVRVAPPAEVPLPNQRNANAVTYLQSITGHANFGDLPEEERTFYTNLLSTLQANGLGALSNRTVLSDREVRSGGTIALLSTARRLSSLVRAGVPEPTNDTLYQAINNLRFTLDQEEGERNRRP